MLASRVFWSLVLLFALVAGGRLLLGRAHPGDLGSETLYRFGETFDLDAAPGSFQLSVYVPREDGRTRLVEERFEVGTLPLDLREDDRGKRMVLTGEASSRGQTIQYLATLRLRPVRYGLDSTLTWDDIRARDARWLASTDRVQTLDRRIQKRLAKILGFDATGRSAAETSPASNTTTANTTRRSPAKTSPASDAGGARSAAPSVAPDARTRGAAGAAALGLAATWRRALEARGVTPVKALRVLYEYCLHDIAPAGFSGSTGALTALRLGQSSCGGKSRLMAAFCRNLGIPSRLVGGVILSSGMRKRTSHVWLECLLAGEWVPFDPLNDHFAEIPGTYLVLYRGDEPLIQHSRGLAFDYAFTAHAEEAPRLWIDEMFPTEAVADQLAGEPTRRIPLLTRQRFSVILLAPFALLLTVILRQVVGLESMGVFLPVLLGFSLTQTGWLVGGVQLLFAVALGVGVRYVLSRLRLLHVPRNAIMISLMVVLFLVSSAILEGLGLTGGSTSLLLPLAALAMTVEKYTVTAMDLGHRDALSFLLQTFALAAGCWLVLTTAFFKVVTVAYPEVFLLVFAELVMLGNYRGLRLRELWRFRSVTGGATLGGEPMP